MSITQGNMFGLKIAKQFVNASEEEWPKLFHDLYCNRKLSKAIHEINALQRNPAHSDVANAAIRRMGFDV